ncbi:hypothetical protein [Flavobacterium sp.]|uniref:hypothetical protein n=1 Tax=Flavobacterium sp. TaxID=239 RepID=UPI002622E73D|nr:hypothetical protein [Flavobacterium sp.]MDG2432971.1 hypothetical protein [Flavobacterium sp.]
MKIFRNKNYCLLIFLLGVMNAFAGTAPSSGPPSPTGKPPIPPGLPIDDYIVLLVIIAVLFGYYVTESRRIKTKPSI